MCESRSSTTSWPVRVWLTTETRLPMVPEATKSPAALPRRSAASASSRLTVGSSSQPSSPTSARAMASRISGVGSVSVSERRSTMSCTGRLPLGPQSRVRATAPLGEPVVHGQAAEQLVPLGRPSLVEVHLGEQEQRLRDHERPRVFLEHQLESLTRRARITLIEVVGRDPELLLREPAAADVDLREAIGGVSARPGLLEALAELLDRLHLQPPVLLDRRHIVGRAHLEPPTDEVGDLVAREERQERPQLAHP